MNIIDLLNLIKGEKDIDTKVGKLVDLVDRYEIDELIIFTDNFASSSLVMEDIHNAANNGTMADIGKVVSHITNFNAKWFLDDGMGAYSNFEEGYVDDIIDKMIAEAVASGINFEIDVNQKMVEKLTACLEMATANYDKLGCHVLAIKNKLEYIAAGGVASVADIVWCDYFLKHNSVK